MLSGYASRWVRSACKSMRWMMTIQQQQQQQWATATAAQLLSRHFSQNLKQVIILVMTMIKMDTHPNRSAGDRVDYDKERTTFSIDVFEIDICHFYAWIFAWISSSSFPLPVPLLPRSPLLLSTASSTGLPVPTACATASPSIAPRCGLVNPSRP